MGPGKYGFFPLHFLTIHWPHYSLFTRGKCFHFIIYNRLSSFLIKFPPKKIRFYNYNGLRQLKRKFVIIGVPYYNMYNNNKVCERAINTIN